MSNTVSADDRSIERPVPEPRPSHQTADSIANPEWIYVDGSMVPRGRHIHVSSVAARYGTSVFESMCVLAVGAGNRSSSRQGAPDPLAPISRIMEIDCDYSDADLMDQSSIPVREKPDSGRRARTAERIRHRRGLSECPGRIGWFASRIPRPETPIDQRGRRQREHLAACRDSVMPMRIKAGANYQNSRFGPWEHAANVMTRPSSDHGRKGSEGGHSCFAMVRDGMLITPPVLHPFLESVTRSTLLELPRTISIWIQEREIDRANSIS